MHTIKKAPPASQVFESWLTLEVLTPHPLPKAKDLEAVKRQLVRLDNSPEPWNQPTKNNNPKEKGHFWFVYLGEINLNAVIESLLKLFPDKGNGDYGPVKGDATMAVVVLDSNGRPVDDKTFISSFAWGYGKVLDGALKTLHSFIDDEKIIVEEFNKLLISQDEDGNIKSLTNSHIIMLCDWLIERLKLPIEQIRKPGIAVRVPIWSEKKDTPEPELLNSFFLEDLYNIKGEFEKNKTIGFALKTYMKAISEKNYADIVINRSLLNETIRPSRIPRVRWPVNGRHSLYLMQQVAVNHVHQEMKKPSIAAINGPPGTGKTTLLRDIVAKVVYERALVLTDYKNPEEAFTHSGKIRTGNAFTHLYDLDKRLLGHEIVVASSNNKAVENISKDIPGIDEITDDFSEPLRFFSTVADCLAADQNDRKKATLPSACWGTAAAVLGNSSNKNAFVENFWWHKQFGMLAYLKSVGKDIDEDSPNISTLESSPTSHQQAVDNWKLISKEFKAQDKKVQEIITGFDKIHDSLLMLDDVTNNHEQAKTNFNDCIIDYSTKQSLYEDVKKSIILVKEDEKSNFTLLSATKDLNPGFFSRLFRTKVFKQWKEELSEILDNIKNLQKEKKLLEINKTTAKKEYELASKAKDELENKLNTIKEQYDRITKTISSGRELLGQNFPDNEFWRKPDKVVQKLSPWMNEYIQNERDELFALSFKVHRAFIDINAKHFRNNLNAMMIILKNGCIDSDYEKTIPSLWATLFMVVPVVSTTFASFSRLFSTLGCEVIGWLLLDESGQALPQAAVGAIWRSKRVVVIGDPLQIEPVVSIPKQLIKAIYDEYKVEIDDWAPPVMSVQTLADRTSWFGSMVEVNDGEIWVGSPLRVHRRCSEPMFSIANKVAYNGLMVSDTPKSHSAIGDVLGDSVWLNIESLSIGKWSYEEGKLVVSLLHQLFDNNILDPDIFIITPFRNIADQLTNMVVNDAKIKNVIGKQFIRNWGFNRIGTVHTFQGKEAEAVIFVLGATGDDYAGSRTWAGSSPNILNVAVTRAKQRLYVIGNKSDWQSAGVFNILTNKLKIAKSDSIEPSLI